MHKAHSILLFAAALAGTLAAQVASVLPADRLAFANQLSKRGLWAEAAREYEALRNVKALPRDEVFYRLAEAYRHAGRAAEALGAYDALLKNHPASRFVDYARLNRALLLTDAARATELAKLDHPKAPERIRASALYHLGLWAESKKDVHRALDCFERAAAVSPTNDVARFSLLHAAAIRSASADAAQRRRALMTYLDLSASPDAKLAEEASFFAAMLTYRDARYAEAASLFHRLAAQYPDSPRTRECRIYAAWANYLAGRYTEALALATPLREEGLEDAAYLTAASLKALERRADARAAYDVLLARFPQGRYADAAWFERLGLRALDGDAAGVLADLAARGDPPAAHAEQAWSYGCEAAIAVTNFPQAVEYARRVAERKESPLAADAMHRLAWLLEQTGDLRRAAQAYRVLAQRWPAHPRAAQALYQAGVTESKSGHAAQAQADWTALLARFPASPFAAEALYARAMEELRQKAHRAAERSLDELLTRFPKTAKRAEALYWRGVAAQGYGDAPAAERHFRAALAAHPSSAFAEEVKLELACVLQARGSARESAALFGDLLATRVVERLAPARLAWIAETLCASGDATNALAAATLLEKRNVDASWNQIAATAAGAAHAALGETDAAKAAYARALACDARAVAGARAALALGQLESAGGLFDEARAHLADAVERAHAREHAALRLAAYRALARNEEERGDDAAALGYHMLVGTLFDDPVATPEALARAAELLRRQGKTKEADALAAERRKRYPAAPVQPAPGALP